MKYKNNSFFLSFEETRKYARNLGLKTAREWKQIKHPINIYRRPDNKFRNTGWTNWNDFLGKIKKRYLSFEDTKKYAKSLNLNSSCDWLKIKHPNNIYINPHIAFKNNGWTNWKDFLGITNKYLSYEDTKRYAKSLNINSSFEWQKIKHPNNIYERPEISFKNKGWTNWIDFLGITNKYLSYEETREYARTLGLKTAREWQKIKHPINIYRRPDNKFRNTGWTNWGDFLGITNKYLSYEETKEYAKSLNINSSFEWQKIKHPINIYKKPEISFKNKGWTNWKDFLDITNKYFSYEDTKKYAKSLNINSSFEWQKIKHPEYIYKRPETSFKNKGWTNWDEFFGI